VLTNYLIGLREGIEAALLVGILVAYLVRAGRRDRLAPVWIGIALAIAVSIAFGAVLTLIADSLGESAEKIFAGSTALLAVGFVTWMIFWMKGAARGLSADLKSKLGTAVEVGAWAVGATAFLAVAREGLETALFLWSSINSGSEALANLVGAILGLATAIALGYLIYKGSLRINLAAFFRWTSIALIVVAAGLVAFAVHEFQEVGLLGGGETLAFDVTSWLDPESLPALFLGGMFNIEPTMTVGQVLAWLLYLVPTLFLYLRPAKAQAPAAPQAPAAAQTPSTEQQPSHSSA